MIVMQYGDALQKSDWIVQESQPPQYVRIYLIHSGDVVYHDAVSRIPLKKGRLYVFPAQQAYSLIQSKENPIDCMWIHADVFPYIVRQMVEINPAALPELRSTLELLRNQINYPGTNAACVEAFGMALLQLLIRDGFLHERIDSRLIDSGMFSLDASVESVSKNMGYTEEHFIRLFSKTVGVTPYQYILSQRMNEAISLMHQGMLMEEVAARTGYASGKSFAGAFKRRFGISPKAYREHFLKKA